MAFADGAPVVDGSATHRVGPDADASATNRIQVEDTAEVVNVGSEVVVGVGGIGAPGSIVGNPLDASISRFQELVRPSRNP